MRSKKLLHVRVEGFVHERIWFAKAGKGTVNDTGISPPPDQHLQNGAYILNLALFDPTSMTLNEATAAGKEHSLYPGYGAQFGAQIWRMAHEAKVGDYIFLETENHHIHAVGIITGDYIRPHHTQYTDEIYNTTGIHAIPVQWFPIKNGKDYIQLGRLDNLVFREISQKGDLPSLLIFGVQKMMAEVLGIDYADFEKRMSELADGSSKSEDLKGLKELVLDESYVMPQDQESDDDSGYFEATLDSVVEEKLAEPEEVSLPVVELPKPVIAHVARNGVYIHQKIDEQSLHDLIKSGQVVNTDHVYHPVSINWITVSEYKKHQGLA